MNDKNLNEITDQIANGLYELSYFSNTRSHMDNWFELLNVVIEKLQDMHGEFDGFDIEAEVNFVGKATNGPSYEFIGDMSIDEYGVITCIDCLEPIDECTHAS
jgi:hypothetical protein